MGGRQPSDLSRARLHALLRCPRRGWARHGVVVRRGRPGGQRRLRPPARLSRFPRVGYRSLRLGQRRLRLSHHHEPPRAGWRWGHQHGTYLLLEADAFVRMPGGGGNFRPSGAFSAPDEGWLEGPVHITRHPEGGRLSKGWPLAARAAHLRHPRTGERPRGHRGPGARRRARRSRGAATRESGWVREFLLSSSGSVVRNTLRGVAWPEPKRAHAVGDSGAMWQWREENRLWERDPGAPIGFEGNLMDAVRSLRPRARLRRREGRHAPAIRRAGRRRRCREGSRGQLLPDRLCGTRGAGRHGERPADQRRVRLAGRRRRSCAAALDRRDRAAVRGRGPPGWRRRRRRRAHRDRARRGGRAVALRRSAAAGLDRDRDAPRCASRDVRAVVSVLPDARYPIADIFPPPDPNVPPPIVSPVPPAGRRLPAARDRLGLARRAARRSPGPGLTGR